MATANTTSTAGGSFQDAHGATVIIPKGQAQDYAGVRAEQLAALTQLLTNAAVGSIELDKKAVEHFQLMANEYAHAVYALIDIVADDAAVAANGGA